MTTYFDTVSSHLRDLGHLRLADLPIEDPLAAAEARLVREVSVAAMLPGFPADLALAVHCAVLRGSVATREPALPPVGREPEAWLRRLGNMNSTLHTIFHEVGRAEIERVTDAPGDLLRVRAEDASDERLALWQAEPSAADPPAALPPRAAGAYYDGVEARLDALLVRLGAGGSAWEDLRAVEEDLVRDASVAAMLPGFPEVLRPAVHRAVLGGSVATREQDLPPADFEEDAVWVERLRGMLRGVAEALAAGGLDSPLAPLDALSARASEARLALFALDPEAAESILWTRPRDAGGGA